MPCPHCGADIHVPDPNPALTPQEADPQPEPEQTPEPAPAATTAPALDFPNPFAPQPTAESWLTRLPDGSIFGPVDRQKLELAAAAGRLPPGTTVKRNHETIWRPLSMVLGTAPAPAVHPQQSPPPYGQHPVPEATLVPSPLPPKIPEAPSLVPRPPSATATALWSMYYFCVLAIVAIGGVLNTLAVLVLMFGNIKMIVLLPFVLVGNGGAFWLLKSTFYESPGFFQQYRVASMQRMFGYHATRAVYMIVGYLLAMMFNGYLLLLGLVLGIGFFFSGRESDSFNNIPVANQNDSSSGNSNSGNPPTGGGPSFSNVPLGTDTAPIDPSPRLRMKLTSQPVLLGPASRIHLNGLSPFIATDSGNSSVGYPHDSRIIDLRDGRLNRREELAYTERVTSVSPDGETMVTLIDHNNSNFNSPNNLAYTVRRPNEPPVSQRIVFTFANCPTFDGHQMVLESYQKVALFNLDRNRLETQILGRNKFVVTPGGNFVVGIDNRNLIFNGLGTTRSTARVGVEHLEAECNVTFSADGQYVAFVTGLDPGTSKILSYASAASTLHIWDLANKREAAQVALPPQSQQVYWLGRNYLLCGDYLVNVSDAVIVARYQTLPTERVPIDHQFWSFNRGFPAWLIPTELPRATDLSLLTSSATRRAKRVLGPGDAVSVELQLSPSTPAGEKSKLQTASEKLIADHGFVVQVRQPNVLRISINDIPTGNPDIPYGEVQDRDPFGRGQPNGKPKFTVPDRALVLRLELLINNRVVHQGEIRKTTNDVNGVDNKGWLGATANDVLNKRWELLGRELKQAKLPREFWNFDNILVLPINIRPPSLASSEVPPEYKPVPYVDRQPTIPRPANPLGNPPDFSRPARAIPAVASPRIWNVEPDPIPEFKGKLVAVPMPLGNNYPRQVKFSDANVAQAAVVVAADDDSSLQVQRWDLVKKRQLSATPVPEDSRLLDFRPDGAVFATIGNYGDADILIWSCGTEKIDKLVTGIPRGDRRSRGAKFCGKNLFLALTTDGILRAYTLPTGTIAYEVSNVSDFPAFSWGRKYFVRYDVEEKEFTIHNTADGSVAGILERVPDRYNIRAASSRQSQSHPQAAFHPDGKHLAICTSRAGLGVWNLEDGKLVQWCQGEAGDIRWCSSQHLLINGLSEARLYDMVRGRVVWRYDGTSFAPDSPDGKGWFYGSLSTRTSNARYGLASLHLPTTNVTKAIDQAEEARRMLLPEGSQVRLEIDMSQAYERAAVLEPQIRERVISLLEKNHVTVTPLSLSVVKVKCTVGHLAEDYVIEEGGRKWPIPNYQYQLELAVEPQTNIRQYVGYADLKLTEVEYKFDASHEEPVENLLQQQDEAFLQYLDLLIRQQVLKAIAQTYVPVHWSDVDMDGERIR